MKRLTGDDLTRSDSAASNPQADGVLPAVYDFLRSIAARATTDDDDEERTEDSAA